jgi:hypothetical protein
VSQNGTRTGHRSQLSSQVILLCIPWKEKTKKSILDLHFEVDLGPRTSRENAWWPLKSLLRCVDKATTCWDLIGDEVCGLETAFMEVFDLMGMESKL